MPLTLVEGIWPYRPVEFRPALLCGTVRSEYALELEFDESAQRALCEVTEILRDAFGRLPDDERTSAGHDFDGTAREAAERYGRRKALRLVFRRNAGRPVASRERLLGHLDEFRSSSDQLLNSGQKPGVDEITSLLRDACQRSRMVRCHLMGLLAWEDIRQLRPFFSRVLKQLRPLTKIYVVQPDLCRNLTADAECFIRNIWTRYHFLRLLRDVLYKPYQADKLIALAVMDMVQRRSVQGDDMAATVLRLEDSVGELARMVEQAALGLPPTST